jgi:hypothetical protein
LFGLRPEQATLDRTPVAALHRRCQIQRGMFAPTGRSFSLTRLFETFVLAPVRGSG